MSFWTTIADVSSIITVGTVVWQVGKALLKKIPLFPITFQVGNGCTVPFKKTLSI